MQNTVIQNENSLCSLIDNALSQTNTSKHLLKSPYGILNYGEVNKFIPKLARWAKSKDLKTGERVLIATKNDLLGTCLFFGFIRLGLTVIFGDSYGSEKDLDIISGAARPSAAFVDEDLIQNSQIKSHLTNPENIFIVEDDFLSIKECEPVDILPDVDDTNIALIVSTSGTTSKPKGVQLSHRNIASQITTFLNIYGFDSETRLLNVLPFHHVDGLIRGPVSALICQGTVFRPFQFHPQKIPEFFNIIQNENITHLISVPTMLALIKKWAPVDESCFRSTNFRFIISSADLLDETLWSGFEEQLGTRIANSYGLSEVVCDAIFSTPEGNLRKIGSLGQPVGCNAKIVDNDGQECVPGQTGEIIISGSIVMQGYFEQPEETDKVIKNGWFFTGDLAYIDDDGFFIFAGRKKTVIVRGGVNIHPENISTALQKMQGVLDCVTFGLADDIGGEKVISCIVIDDLQEINVNQVMDYCRSVLSAEKIPSEIHILESLPRGPAGKVLLNKIKEQVANLPSTEIDSRSSLTVLDQILQIAARCFKVDVVTLNIDSSPFNTEGWDSLAHLQFIESIEKHFEIILGPEDIMEIGSIEDTEYVVDNLLNS
jgi:long-chain acyl-CoA synthetase